VDLRSSSHLPGGEVLHASAAEWTEFIAAVKDGKFDDVKSAGSPTVPRATLIRAASGVSDIETGPL
jgi:hypothetical protein